MKAVRLLAIAIVGFGIGVSQLLGDDLQIPPVVTVEAESETLAPIISLSEYEKRDGTKVVTAGLDADADSELDLSLLKDEVFYQPPSAREAEDAEDTDFESSETTLPALAEDPFTDERETEPADEADSAAPSDAIDLSPEEDISPVADDYLQPLEAIAVPPLGVGTAGMELACGKNWSDNCPCQACCLPHWRTFGDALLLRPTNAEVAYGETINGPITQPPSVPLQLSPIATVEPDFEPGVRVGISRVFCDCSSLTLTYSHLDTDTFSEVSAQPPLVLRSMVRHPGDQTAAIDNLFAEAHYDISFQMVDLDYRDVWKSCPWYSISYLVGVRYGHLKQDFASEFSSLGTEYVSTAIDFDGGGLRVGLEGERRLGCTGLSVYGRGIANILGGEFTGTYHQSNTFAGPVVETSWKAQRIVSILDLEAGVQYTCCGGCVNLSAGYAFSGWYNTVTTQDFISAVQTNDFDDLSNILGFEGFVARAEVRF